MPPRATITSSPLFQFTQKYPIGSQLASIFKYDARHNTRSEKAPDTIDVVSPEACDDILEYIAPTLKDHQGCDIIDIHPGACLWSQKLHQFLKPRRHLLMEPEEGYMKPFIQPLLDTPNSAYRHTLLSGAHPKSYFESYEQIFNDALLPKRDAIPPGDPRLRQPNKTLLVTGTLSRRYRKIRGHNNNVHNANLILNHMIQAAQTNSLFHSYGLIRMLFWHPEDTKASVIPDLITARGAYTAAIDFAADLVEIAGKDRSPCQKEATMGKRMLSRLRHPEIEQIGADRVLEKMDKAAIHMPAHRRGVTHQAAIDRQSTTTIAEREAEYQRFIPFTLPLDMSIEQAVDMHQRGVREYDTWLEGRERDLPYQFLFTGVAKTFFTENEKSKIGPYMDLWGRQFALEKAVLEHQTQNPGSKSDEMTDRMRKMATDLRNTFTKKSKIAPARRASVAIVQNEVRGTETEILAHDRRPFEPLILQNEEFWPQFPMFLVDIQPRSPILADDIASPTEASAILRHLVMTLWQLSASSVPMAVGRIGSNAAEHLVPNMPDLTDTRKGGRLDAEDMTVRMLTRDMIHQLTGAYLEWPFRPSSPHMEDTE